MSENALVKEIRDMIAWYERTVWKRGVPKGSKSGLLKRAADEIERLQPDACRYRFLKKHNPLWLASIARGLSPRAAKANSNNVDQVIDITIEELSEAENVE